MNQIIFFGRTATSRVDIGAGKIVPRLFRSSRLKFFYFRRPCGSEGDFRNACENSSVDVLSSKIRFTVLSLRVSSLHDSTLSFIPRLLEVHKSTQRTSSRRISQKDRTHQIFKNVSSKTCSKMIVENF